MAHQWLAEFADADALVAAAHRLRDAGAARMEAYTPFAIPELEEVLGIRRSKIALFVFLAGLAGGGSAYWLQWWLTVRRYPINVGGRPLHSAPAFIPVTFELTVLAAGLTAFFAFVLLGRLGRLWSPLDEIEGFEAHSREGYFLRVEHAPPLRNDDEVRSMLEASGAVAVRVIDLDGVAP